MTVTSDTIAAKQWYECGYERKRAGDNAGSLDAFRHSIKLNGRAAAPWIGIAQLLHDNHQLEQARQCLVNATQAQPNHLLARQLLADSHKALGYVDQAKAEFEYALALSPNNADTWCGLGLLYEDLGESKQAAAAYRQALAINPKLVDALAGILGLARDIDIDNEISLAQLQLDSLVAKDKALLAYGLGKAFDLQGNYKAAFNAYQQANQARRQQGEIFQTARFNQRIESMIKLFSAAFFNSRKAWGNRTAQPVFIVGLPRSGTTLTEQILSAHPQCFGAGELAVLTDLATGTPDRLGNPNTAWPQCVKELSPQHILAIAEDYLTESSSRAPQSVDKVIDKQPLNFWHIGLIALAFPNAKIIHCTRDIRDCGLSIFSQNFNVQQNWSTDLDDIVTYWRGYQRLMSHFKQVSGLDMLEVAYEDTVADSTKQSQRLLEFVELDWDESVLNFHNNQRAVQTPSRWQVRQPIYRTAKAKWRRYADNLQPLIDAVGQ